MNLKIFSRAILIIIILYIGILMAMAQDSTSTDLNKSKYPKVLIYKGDTVMAFTIPMAYDLAHKRDSLKSYVKLYNNSLSLIDTLQGKIEIKDQIIEKDSVELQATNGLVRVANDETKVARKERDYYKKKYRNAKITTGAVIVAGLTGWVLYIFK